MQLVGQCEKQRPARDREILQIGRPGIAGFQQHQQPLAAPRPRRERLQGVAAEIGAEGDGVGLDRTVIVEIGGGVIFGRAANIAAFGVQQDRQIAGAGVVDNLMQGFDAGPAEPLEHGDLRLDHDHPAGDAVQKSGQKSGHRRGCARIAGGHGAISEKVGNPVEKRIEPGA